MPDADFRMLLDMYREDDAGANRDRWVAACTRYLSSGLRPAILDELGREACVVLHGSTTRNVDDAYSDLDCYLIVDGEQIARLGPALQSHFVEFTLDGKPGHLNVTLPAEIEAAFRTPSLETIYELRHAVAVLDPSGRFGPIARRAREPMSDAVLRAAIMHHYMEMRSAHRSADNPLDRHDEYAALVSIIEAMNHGLRCSMLLDRRPFPYAKWLRVAASLAPTGRAVSVHVDVILDLLRTDPSALNGPEKANPVSLRLREIRRILVDAARASGIDEPWLTKWWCYLDRQKAVFDGVEWGG